jgi:hypothetical protein
MGVWESMITPKLSYSYTPILVLSVLVCIYYSPYSN